MLRKEGKAREFVGRGRGKRKVFIGKSGSVREPCERVIGRREQEIRGRGDDEGSGPVTALSSRGGDVADEVKATQRGQTGKKSGDWGGISGP